MTAREVQSLRSHSPLRSPVAFALLALYTLGCILAVALRPSDVFWTVDNGNKWLQSRSSDGFDLPYPGQELDPEMRFAPIGTPFGHVVVDGEGGKAGSAGNSGDSAGKHRLLSQYPPTFAAISRPFLGLGDRGRFILPLLGAVLTAFGAAALAVRLGASPGWALAFSGPLGPVMFYASTFWEHTLVTALLIWAWWALASTRPKLRAQVGAALLFAVATALREETVLLALATGGAMLLGGGNSEADDAGKSRRMSRGEAESSAQGMSSWKSALLFGFAYAAFLVPFFIWMKVETGSFFGLHFQGNVGSESWSLQARWTVLRALLWSGDEGLLEAFAGVSTLVAFALIAVAGMRSRRRAPRRKARLEGRHNSSAEAGAWPLSWTSGAAAILVGVAALLTAWSLHRETDMPQTLVRTAGLLLFAPWSVWVLRGWRPTTLHWTALFSLGLFILVTPPISAFGVHWGPRILLSLVPLIGVLAAKGIAEAGRNGTGSKAAWKSALSFMAVALLSLQLYGIVVQNRILEGTSRLLETTRTRAALGESVAGDRKPILTHFFWYAQVLAPLHLERPLFQVRNPSEFGQWVDRFREQGGGSFFWVAAPNNAQLPPNLPLRKVRTEEWKGYPRIYDHLMIEIEVATKDRP